MPHRRLAQNLGITSYQPKGGMCGSCQNVQRDCSSLPFDQMPVIEVVDSSAIVRCINHQPHEAVKPLMFHKEAS